jgi:peroxiredoxin
MLYYSVVDRSVRPGLAFVSSAALLAALIAATACTAAPAKNAVGQTAPAFTAQDLDGKPVALTNLRGKVVVLNEWATWCGPCAREIPQLESLYKAFTAQGLAMVGVSVDAFGTGGDVRDFARDHGITYAIWLDPDKRFATQFLTIGVPETFVIGRGGKIRMRHIGAFAEGDTTLATEIRTALAEH